MTPDETRAQYLATGEGEHDERLDLIREVLAEAATWAEPPPQVAEGMLAAVSRDRHPMVESGPGRKAMWPLVAAVVGSAAAVVALVLASMSVVASDEETVLAMAGTEIEPAATGRAAVHPAGSGWWIRLDLRGLPPAPEGSYYEGWVWSDDGEGVSIGTFHLRGGESPVTLWSGVAMADYPSIWVTLEPEDQGPEASDHVVMKGRMPEVPEA
ncbi:MAG: anti-sigma factor [Acidimicrobiia bacterium]